MAPISLLIPTVKNAQWFKSALKNCCKFWKMDGISKFEVDIRVRIHRRDLTLILSIGPRVALICIYWICGIEKQFSTILHSLYAALDSKQSS